VLGELLHSLSQPLTGLRCSLELSLEEAAERQRESVAIALQQTEKVIGMIQLMREYLDAEQPTAAFQVALAPLLRNVVEELSSIAAVRDVQLRLVGNCTAAVPVPEARLRLALQYLIATWIETQPAGGRVLLALTESPAGTVLRMEGERGSGEPKFRGLDFRDLTQGATSRQTKRDPLRATSATTSALRRVRLAIARRVLETAGASLVLGDGDGAPAGFVLRIPRGAAPPV
jgi:hypothetical protein